MNMLATMPDPNTYSAIGWLLVGLGALFTILNQGKKFFDGFKDKPAPGDVQRESADKYATKAEFREHVAENKLAHDRFDVRIGGVDRKGKEHADVAIERLRQERREDMRILHTEINEVGKKVAALDTKTDSQNAWLARMDEKLDNLQSSKT